AKVPSEQNAAVSKASKANRDRLRVMRIPSFPCPRLAGQAWNRPRQRRPESLGFNRYTRGKSTGRTPGTYQRHAYACRGRTPTYAAKAKPPPQKRQEQPVGWGKFGVLDGDWGSIGEMLSGRGKGAWG